MRLVWAKTAREDLNGIFDHIVGESPRAALDQLDEIENQVRHLISNPGLGRSGRQFGTRELVIARTPYLAVYRLGQDRVDVIRIIHGAQQWPPQDRRDED